jgi:hypothetical protein
MTGDRIPFVLVTPRGRRSPALAWPVRTVAGDTWHLSGLQRAALFWLTARARHGRHTATVTELGAAIGCNRGTASKILRRLRSLSLIGAPRPHRGRFGGFRYWTPRAGSVLADAARRRQRWPTRANDSTPTPTGRFLTRAGMRRSWVAAARGGGGPPVAAAPRRGASPGGLWRARGRPWPPRYVDERCSLDGGRVRLARLRDRGAESGDLAAVYGGRCPRCSSSMAASVVLVRPVESFALVPASTTLEELVSDRLVSATAAELPAASAPAVDPVRAAAALELAPLVDRHPAAAAELLVRHAGYRRRAQVVPPLRPVTQGGPDELPDIVDRTWSATLADLFAVLESRRLDPPG